MIMAQMSHSPMQEGDADEAALGEPTEGPVREPREGAVSRPWAWPLASAAAPSLARYETLARELVARHGLAGHAGLGSVRLLAAAADALALLRFDLEVQHARAPNASFLPGAAAPPFPQVANRTSVSYCGNDGRAGAAAL